MTTKNMARLDAKIAWKHLEADLEITAADLERYRQQMDSCPDIPRFRRDWSAAVIQATADILEWFEDLGDTLPDVLTASGCTWPRNTTCDGPISDLIREHTGCEFLICGTLCRLRFGWLGGDFEMTVETHLITFDEDFDAGKFPQLDADIQQPQ